MGFSPALKMQRWGGSLCKQPPSPKKSASAEDARQCCQSPGVAAPSLSECRSPAKVLGEPRQLAWAGGGASVRFDKVASKLAQLTAVFFPLLPTVICSRFLPSFGFAAWWLVFSF